MIPKGTDPNGTIFKNDTKGDRPQWYHFFVQVKEVLKLKIPELGYQPLSCGS
jgi:hypothetical protein